jgi:hypothetical protein
MKGKYLLLNGWSSSKEATRLLNLEFSMKTLQRCICLGISVIILSACQKTVPTDPSAATESASLTANPNLNKEPGLYLLHPANCAEIPIETNNGIKTWMDLCVTSVSIETDGNLRFNVAWIANAEQPTLTIQKASDEKDTGIYVTDEAGKRYDHIDMGGAAMYDLNFYLDGAIKQGWYLFPPVNDYASSLTFHDENQGLVVENITLSERATYTVTSTKIMSNDIIFDPTSRRIYASVSNESAIYPDTIVSIDPSSMDILNSIDVSSTPKKLEVSQNGQYLYAGLDNEQIIQRIALQSETLDLSIKLTSANEREQNGLYAEDIVSIPGLANTIAVAISKPGDNYSGVAIYDNDVRRPLMSPRGLDASDIEPSASSTILYGYSLYSSKSALTIMRVATEGIEIESINECLLCLIEGNISFADSGHIHGSPNNFIYSNGGGIINPEIPEVIGTFNTQGSIYPDIEKERAYFLTYDNSTIPNIVLEVFDLKTFAPITSFSIPGAISFQGDIIKVGATTLAFRTSGEIFFINERPE